MTAKMQPDQNREEISNKGAKQVPSPPSYHWDPNADFTLKGAELEFILHTVHTALSTENARQVLSIFQVSQIVEAIMRKGIDSGIVKNINNE